MSRQDQYNVTVVVTFNGETRSLGTFDKMSGGLVDSEELKYRPGAMGAQVSLGGYKSVENITVSRLFDLSRDLPQVPWLIAAAGKGDVTVTKQSLDVDGNAFGSPLVYSGRLKKVNPPDVDSESNDAALIELEISTASTVGA